MTTQLYWCALQNDSRKEKNHGNKYDPHMDVHIGDFVGVQAPELAQGNGELFLVAKVRELQNVAKEDGEFLALW
jgi:hypothetical protein